MGKNQLGVKCRVHLFKNQPKINKTKKIKKKRCRKFTFQYTKQEEEQEQVKKNYIYICYSDDETDDVCLYKIDANQTSKNNIPNTTYGAISPLCTIPGAAGIGRCYGTAALGSKIYIMGGYLVHGAPDHQGSSYIFSFDTSSTPIQWKRESTRLLARRADPVVEAAHGKIYIFGANLPMPNPWGEVYDPELNICSPLPPPPQLITECPKFSSLLGVVVQQGDLILLSVDLKYVFSFNVLTNTWSRIHVPGSDLGYWCNRSMVIDDMSIMLNFFRGKLLVHDLHTHEWFADPVHGLHIRSMSTAHKDSLEGRVVNHGNNIFSFVWDDLGGNESHVVRCAQFQLTRVADSFRAHILARSSYEITYGDAFGDCFSMS